MTTKPDPAAFLLTVVGDTTGEDREARLKAHNEAARKDLDRLERTVTQGEWLAMTRILDMPRRDIETDQNLNLLAMAYIADKREHGVSSIDVLLELTDEELLAFHGFAVDAEPLNKPTDENAGEHAQDAGELVDALA